MVRLVVSGWVAVLPQRPPAGQAPGHAAVRMRALVRDQAFADSGFWDFALLHLYDHVVRRLVLGGLTALSEFG
jgi:hypothetical protein